jgi:hypothetical protein
VLQQRCPVLRKLWTVATCFVTVVSGDFDKLKSLQVKLQRTEEPLVSMKTVSEGMV